MQNKIECHGCSADLAKGIDIPIHMTGGQLYLACPLCKYESRVAIDGAGKLNLVNNNTTETAMDLIHDIGMQEKIIKEEP